MVLRQPPRSVQNDRSYAVRMGSTPFRAAVVQAAPVAFDPERTLDRVAELSAEAAADGARLAVFPEAFVGGYPKGADFGIRLGSRSDDGRRAFERYFDGAIELPGAAAARLGEISTAHSLELVVGVIEREGGTLYCSTAIVSGTDGALKLSLIHISEPTRPY